MSAALSRKPAFGLPGRIQDPNSRKRSIALVGLGAGGAAIAESLAKQDLGGLDVRVALAPRPPSPDAIARIKNDGDEMHRAVRDADMIFIVACRGDDASLAPVVSRIAHGHSAPVTAIYLVPAGGKPAIDDPTLKTLRTGAEMMVIASDQSYVAAMVAALGG